MKTVNVTLRIDEDLKEQAEALFDDIGLSLNAACRIFLKRAVQEQRIPFELSRPDRKTRKAIADAEQNRGVSGGYDSVDALMEALDELMDNPSCTPADRTSRVIQMACKHAVKGGERLPEESVAQLIRDVIEQKVTPTCPHGRPLMVQITRNELEKRFRRIQN